MMLAVVVFSVWAVFLYNQLVGFRHDIGRIEKLVGQKEVENAELKNSLYALIDSGQSEKLVNNGELVLERNPQYVKQQEQIASTNN